MKWRQNSSETHTQVPNSRFTLWAQWSRQRHLAMMLLSAKNSQLHSWEFFADYDHLTLSVTSAASYIPCNRSPPIWSICRWMIVGAVTTRADCRTRPHCRQNHCRKGAQECERHYIGGLRCSGKNLFDVVPSLLHKLSDKLSGRFCNWFTCIRPDHI